MKQLYTDLLREHKSPTVYINAWKSDFSNDPLLVIISELLEQISSLFIDENDNKKDEKIKKNDEILSKLTTLSKKTYNGALDILAVYISTKNEDWDTGLDATALTAVLSNFKVTSGDKVSIEEPKIGNSLKENYKKQLRAIEDTKILMSEYANIICGSVQNEEQGKIYVLVDELDRCRPSYAIELLETIKHFFDIPNFIFVVATDTKQLSHSIRAVYGNGFNGQEYLSRFFNRTATIPQGDLYGLIKALVKKSSIVESFHSGTILPKASSAVTNNYSREDFITQEITNIVLLYEINPRKIEQLIAKFESIIIESFNDTNVIFDFRILLQLLAEYSTDGFYECYLSRKNSSATTFSATPEAITKFGWGNYNTDLLGHLTRNKPIDKYLANKINDNNEREHYFKEMYKSSWLFLNSCLDPNFILTNLDETFNKYINSNNSNYINNLYSQYLDIARSIEDSNLFWSKEIYFKKVEIGITQCHVVNLK